MRQCFITGCKSLLLWVIAYFFISEKDRITPANLQWNLRTTQPQKEATVATQERQIWRKQLCGQIDICVVAEIWGKSSRICLADQ